MQFKTVKPSGDRVLIKLGVAERQTASGILLPTAAEVEKSEGAVVAVGDGENVTLKARPLPPLPHRAVRDPVASAEGTNGACSSMP